MSRKPKRKITAPDARQPRSREVLESDNDRHPVFLFDLIDRDGKFAFDVGRKDFRHKDVLAGIVDYSRMTWQQIRQQTHDDRKSKHHYLSDAGRLSPEARHRLGKRQLEEKSDLLFSFALTNKLRIVGIKDGAEFHVLWYDPNHDVYPASK